MTRRQLLHASGAAGIAAMLPSRLSALAPEPPPLFSAMGIGARLEQAVDLKAGGAQFLTVPTNDFLIPDQPEAAFEDRLAKLKDSPLPILACNGFLGRQHRCVGPDANMEPILTWAETAFRRANQASVKFIVFGSAAARALPNDWTEAQADEQFTALLKRMGPLAEKSNVTVALEQLQASECNYINHIAHGARLVRAANHPNIRLLADLFHMRRVGDTPADLKAAMDVVAHVEIAELESRSYPGVKGDDFRPFFSVLHQSRYRGAINIEGSGEPSQLPKAFEVIVRQAKEAWDGAEENPDHHPNDR